MIEFFKEFFRSLPAKDPFSLDASGARDLIKQTEDAEYENYQRQKKDLLCDVYGAIKFNASLKRERIIVSSDSFAHDTYVVSMDKKHIEWFAEEFKERFEAQGYKFDYKKSDFYDGMIIRISWEKTNENLHPA